MTKEEEMKIEKTHKEVEELLKPECTEKIENWTIFMFKALEKDPNGYGEDDYYFYKHTVLKSYFSKGEIRLTPEEFSKVSGIEKEKLESFLFYEDYCIEE